MKKKDSADSPDEDATRLASVEDAKTVLNEDETKIYVAPENADATRLHVSPREGHSHFNDETKLLDSSSEVPTQITKQHSPTNEASGNIKIGAVIKDRFLLDSLIGSGGMGMVFSAIDKRKEEAQDKDLAVAIKILGDSFKNHPKAFISLQREAKKSQSLAHPNIINVYDFDRDGDIIFMTMEQLYGETLDQFIKKHPTGSPIEKTKTIVTQMAEALGYAHSKKIIHSDLKPGNIFLTEDGSIKILDFGIARAVSSSIDSEGDNTLFDAAELGGLTPAYASKQMHDGLNPVAQDDIYALGLIAHELICGSHPYNRQPANKVTPGDWETSRPKHIKRHHWKAIRHAIAIEQSERTASTSDFLREFNGISKTRQILIGFSAVALVLSALNFAYRSDNLGPKIPFEELEPAQKEAFRNELALADTAISFSDINGALHYLSKAYEIHPRNPDAVKRLNEIVESVLKEQRKSENPDEIQRQLQQVEVLLKYEALKNDSHLIDRKSELIKINSSMLTD